MKNYVFTATALLSMSAPAMASEPQGNEAPIVIADLKLPDIIVTANRDARVASTVGESVTVLDEATITTRQSVDALPLLSSTPGVTFARNGGIGAASSVYIRGAEADQTVVLFDGVKLTDPAAPGGGFNFGPLMSGEVGTIEIQRGAASVLYGSQAIGGVVHFISRAPSDGTQIRARAEYGSRDSVLASGGVAGDFGPLSLATGVTYVRTDGISAFDEGSEADGFESIGGQFSARLTLSDALSIDLRGLYADGTAAFDGFEPVPPFGYTDAPLFGDRTDYLGYAGVNLSLLDGRFTNRLGVAATRIDRSDEDRSGAAPLTTFDATGKTTRVEYQGGLDLGITELTFGAEREESSYRTEGFGSAETADAWVNSGYVQASIALVRGLSITGGVRHDDHRAFGGNTVFAGSMAYSPNGTTIVRASFGEGFKAPSLFQLYSQYGNEALAPETSQSWDAGVTQSLLDGRAEVSATYFARDSKNLIAYIGCFMDPNPICVGRPFGTYDNIALASAKGVEVGVTLRPADGFSFAANYTHTDSRDEATGLRLARRPADVVNVNVDYAMPFGLAVGVGVQVSGDRFDNAANTRRLDGYTLTDVRASFPLSDGVEIYGRIENLFDVDYATVFQNGQAGRSVFAGVRVSM